MRNLVLAASLFAIISAEAQVVGGRAIFEFLNVPGNAHLAGLGGQNVSVYDRDPNLFLANPALLNKKMDKIVSVSYLPYIADIKLYSLAGAIHFKKLGAFALGLKYMNYGEMDERNEYATYLGTFSSRDYAFTVGKSYTIGTITLGINGKFLASELVSYKTYAWAVDAGALFKHPEHDFTIGMAIKNLGNVYKKYTPTSKDSLPFNVQLGTSYKFQHAPIRISLTAHTLNRWDVVYSDPNNNTKVDENGNAVLKKVKNGERLLRHLIVAMEVMPAKFLNLRIGYNYLMSRELSLTDGISSAGISLGGSIKYNILEAAYTHTIVHRAGGMNVFTLNIDMGKGLQEFKRVEQ